MSLSQSTEKLFHKHWKKKKRNFYLHLSSTVFGISIVCGVIAVAILLIFRVVLTRWGGCSQDWEKGLENGGQQLQLQHRLEKRSRKVTWMTAASFLLGNTQKKDTYGI